MRYLIIVLLLIPAWGWAEAVEKNFVFQDSDGTELLRCDEQAKHCHGPLLEQNTCYQRMREAMQAAHDYVMTGWESYRHNMVILDRERWSQTYKDCVEGK